MKFGKNFPRNQVPEWSASYLNYKDLKRLIKTIAIEARNGKEPDKAPFFYALDRNIETVDGFFNKRLAEAQRRLKLLESRYDEHFDLTNLYEDPENGRTRHMNAVDDDDEYQKKTAPKSSEAWGLDRDEIEELLGALLELRSHLRKILWYGEVNRRGFIKILKKLDKKTGSTSQKQYLDSKVLPQGFATGTEVQTTMHAVNKWLSKIGGAESFNDAEKANGTKLTVRPELKRVSSGAAAGIATGVVEQIDECIRKDDAVVLSDLLKNSTEADRVTPRLVLNLLQRSITARALQCIKFLLENVGTLHEEEDINGRNILHRLIINIGRAEGMMITPVTGVESNVQIDHLSLQVTKPQVFITPAKSPQSKAPTSNTPECDGLLKLPADDESVKLLEYILSNMKPEQREALNQQDTYGRTPLHYAAQYGFVIICRLLIKFMREWNQFDVSDGIDSAKWQDVDGYAPLHLAIVGEHPRTTRTLLQAETWDGHIGQNEQASSARKTVSKTSVALIMAAKRNSVEIVQLLVEAGVDINYQDENGDSALHHAARLGHTECVKALLAGGDGQSCNVELLEKNYGWTPLFIAAVEGKKEVVEVLIEVGHCEIAKVDTSGWTPAEHAALRGHLDIAKLLIDKTPEPGDGSRANTPPLANPAPGIVNLEKNASSTSLAGSLGPTGSGVQNTVQQQNPPIKSFGHRYLKKGQTMVLVTLGSIDMRKNIQPVKLDQIPVSEAHVTMLDTALSLVVSAQNATGEPTIVDLPVHANIATDDPIAFQTTDASSVKIIFDIVPTYAGSKKRIVGRAVAILSSMKSSFGKNRTSLQGSIEVPILSINTLDVIGSVTFEFTIVTPFEHPNVGVTKEHTYWKSLTSPRVIGHRGLGKNFNSRESLQLGENTLLSFITAAKLGAEYVEFDVQLTKDHVPVIYHDFLVGETGIDAPLHTLTFEQFMSMKEEFPRQPSRSGSPDHGWNNNDKSGNNSEDGSGGNTPAGIRRARSMSLYQRDGRQLDVSERMKHSRAFKKNGFKGNTHGFSIQGPFATLEQMFKQLDTSIGFNIELKYPMLQETEEEEMDTTVIEMNAWVDAVLKVVHDHGIESGRNMIFSSFNPDICLMLSFKQPSIPILFLTEAGTRPMQDARASSLQEAIRFASRWNLLGIVSAAEPLVLCPRLIRVVKETGLVCVTYGTLNNEPENVKRQADQGIDAIIADRILKISRAVGAVRAAAAEVDNSKPIVNISETALLNGEAKGNGVVEFADTQVIVSDGAS